MFDSYDQCVIVVANTKMNKARIVRWRSKKFKKIGASSIAAKAWTMNEAIGEEVYFMAVLRDMQDNGLVDIPIKDYADSKNFLRASDTSVLVEDSKLRLDLAILKASSGRKEIDKLVYVIGKRMVADCLTKKGALSKALLKVMRTGGKEGHEVKV